MNTTPPSKDRIGSASVILVTASLVSIVATFVLATSDLDLMSMSLSFAGIIAAYLIVTAVAYFISRSRRNALDDGDDLETQLRLIEDAGRYFGGSLKPADMFRLVASKLGDVVGFDACVLFRVDNDARRLLSIQAQGDNAELFRNTRIPFEKGVAGRSVVSGEIETSTGLLSATEPLPVEALSGFRAAAAVPFKRDGKVIAVFAVYSTDRNAFVGEAAEILEAFCERATPLIAGSISLEISLASAMTDPVTELPNERAFYLVLENQIAESQRNRDDRPLTILAMDILAFEDLNSKYGHAAGDQILGYVAGIVKKQVRAMDLVARTHNDEFLAVLPTANEDMAQEIVRRISTALASSTLFLTPTDALKPELTFGIATFGRNGETAERLLASARLFKNQSKANVPRKVLWFPREFIN